MGRVQHSVTFIEHLQYTVHLLGWVGRRGEEDRTLWRNLVLIWCHFLCSSPLVLFPSFLRGILDSLRPKRLCISLMEMEVEWGWAVEE